MTEAPSVHRSSSFPSSPLAEKPEVPFAIKVLNKSGRTVELSWSAPYNGNSDIFEYIIQYKKAKGTCHPVGST